MKKYTYEDFKKAPIGTKIWYADGNNDINVYIKVSDTDIVIGNVGFELGQEDIKRICRIQEPSYTTVYETEDILDKNEKKYLTNVIEPFKNRDIRIIKFTTPYDTEYISIGINDEHYIDFPYFEEGTMYKGLEPNRHYSLKELGLN